MIKLTHVQQTANGNDCTLACLAMLTGKTLKEVCQALEIDDKDNCYLRRGTFLEEIFYMLRKLDVDYVWQMTTRLVPYRVYLISVPSVNHPEKLHSVVVDYRKKDIKVLDPAKGNMGAKYYKEFAEIPFWQDVIEILL